MFLLIKKRQLQQKGRRCIGKLLHTLVADTAIKIQKKVLREEQCLLRVFKRTCSLLRKTNARFFYFDWPTLIGEHRNWKTLLHKTSAPPESEREQNEPFSLNTRSIKAESHLAVCVCVFFVLCVHTWRHKSPTEQHRHTQKIEPVSVFFVYDITHPSVNYQICTEHNGCIGLINYARRTPPDVFRP